MASIFLLIILAYMFFAKFGPTPQTFILIVPPLLISSLFLGYFLAKEILKPLFDRNEALDKFIKNTLHELNIPVATIKANVDMLKRDEQNPKRVKRLDRIEQASENLIILYEELNYRIKEEIDRIEIENFYLKEAIEESVGKFEEIKKDIHIEIKIDNIEIKADRSGFVRVIDNLVSNAIKYNRDDGYIKIYTHDRELIVEDSGVGIANDEIIHIFDRYYQQNSTKVGFGIGLSVVKSYCDNHKIDIKIDSKSNLGTRFRLNLQKVCQNS
jgi:signal transduction histidine kinase